MPRVTQPAPSYQPYRPVPPMMGAAAPPKRSGGGLTSLLAGILALVAAGLAVGGSFAPITTLRITNEGGGQTTVYGERDGWWSFADDGSTDPLVSESKLLGLALVLGATLLVLGAVFAFTASRTRTSGPTTGSRSLIAAGAGVLTGVALVQALAVLHTASRYNSRELAAGESIDFAPGLGLVLPLCAVGTGLIAVVLAHLGQRPQAARVEPNTPRMGFRAPYGYQPQGAPTPPGAPGTPPPGMPTTGSPAPAIPTETSDDDSETTQVLSNATASGQDAAATTPPSGAQQATPTGAQQATPAAASPAAVTPSAVPAPAAPEGSTASPALGTQSAFEAPAPPAAPEAPKAPAAPAAADAPWAPEAPKAPAASAPPAASEGIAAPQAPNAPESSPASAAPPPPELSDDATKDNK